MLQLGIGVGLMGTFHCTCAHILNDYEKVYTTGYINYGPVHELDTFKYYIMSLTYY